MLSEVHVRDLALLEEVELHLHAGLNVVSGETGEGKSLLLAAIGLLLGARARRGLVRSGSREAVVEGRFLLDDESRERVCAICDLIPQDARELCLRRVVTSTAGSRAYLDGACIPLSLLARLGAGLVDVHGQSDQLSLKQTVVQARVLDRFGGLEQQARSWAATWRELSQLQQRRNNLQDELRQRQDRRDLLQFQVQELDQLEPRVGEESALTAELELLERGLDVKQALRQAAEQLVEQDGSVTEVCAALERSFGQALPQHEVFTSLRERLRSLHLEAEDLGRECAGQEDRVDWNPARQDELTQRLDGLRILARRHAVPPDQLADVQAALRAELSALKEQTDQDLDLRCQQLASALVKSGRKLARARARAASKLESEIHVALADLRMPDARLQVQTKFERTDEEDVLGLGELGPGAARFFVSANQGEPLQPLEHVASGGETARIMLALRGALAGHHRIPLLIFDEIDAGIGARVGVSFGRRIAAIAQHHQVLVVTHLPQVAAFADTHLRVVKAASGGRTRSQVQVLERKARVQELADMLGGEIAPAAARAQARALIKEAQA